MAKARSIEGLSGRSRLASAGAAAVEVRSAEVFERASRALEAPGVEAVHDLRVATRRLRAALEVFAVCFAGKPHASALADVKRLADVLGERRDADVALAMLDSLHAALGAAERPGIESLASELRARRGRAGHLLEAELERVVAAGLERRLLELAAGARGEERPA